MHKPGTLVKFSQCEFDHRGSLFREKYANTVGEIVSCDSGNYSEPIHHNAICVLNVFFHGGKNKYTEGWFAERFDVIWEPAD